MDFEIGSLVTRNSHGNDLIFTITDIIDDVYYLKGLNIRLVADATKDDLKKYEDGDIEDEKEFLDRIKPVNDLDRDDYFYLPGKILHIDGDKEYKNSMNFVNAVKEARKYEKEHDKLIIIAGACQSNYEELIKAGANFASSPKRINIHALDPAIIATKISLTDVNKQIDVKSILKETKYGESGIGGIITKGTMYVGYPR